MTSTSSIYRNLLLQSLAPDLARLFQPHLEIVVLNVGLRIENAGDPINHVYFPESGMFSIEGRGPKGHSIQVGMIGYEGFSGHALVMGVTKSEQDIFVSVGGRAHRLSAKLFTWIISNNAAIRDVMLKSVSNLFDQIATSVCATASGQTHTRLARWLLMAADRTIDSHLYTTHEAISKALGVRRPSITDAFHRLEGERLIKSTRGLVRILDRERLENYADALYQRPPFLNAITGPVAPSSLDDRMQVC